MYVMVDVESDGPIPGDYSMIEFGAIAITNKDGDPKTFPTFHGRLRPISDRFVPQALSVSGYTREATMKFDEPSVVMKKFWEWLSGINKPILISDNNGYDAMFIAWYFHHFVGDNPFGHSSTNLGSLYKGLVKSVFENFKHLRKTKHTHNPLDDAMGNVEAFLAMRKEMGLKF